MVSALLFFLVSFFLSLFGFFFLHDCSMISGVVAWVSVEFFCRNRCNAILFYSIA